MTETTIGVSGAYLNLDETYSGAMNGIRRRAKLYCTTIFAVNSFRGTVIDQRPL